jgi:hypothetical protein
MPAPGRMAPRRGRAKLRRKRQDTRDRAGRHRLPRERSRVPSRERPRHLVHAAVTSRAGASCRLWRR